MSRRLLFWWILVISLMLAILTELVYSREHGVIGRELFPILIDSVLKCLTGLLISSVFFACRHFIKSEWLGMGVGCLLTLILAIPSLNGYGAVSMVILGTNHPSAQQLSVIVGLSVPFGIRFGLAVSRPPASGRIKV